MVKKKKSKRKVFMLRRKYNYVIYDDSGYVIIISRNKRIAMDYAKGKYNGSRG